MGKRKSEASQAASQNGSSKRTAAASASGPVHMELQSGQAVQFTGATQLTVRQGAVWVAGRVLTPEAGTVAVCADTRTSGPLAIEATNAGVQIPCVGSGTASITMDSQQPVGGAASATGGNTSAEGHGTCLAAPQHSRSFEVTQPAAPAEAIAASQSAMPQAPDYSPAWRQAAAALATVQGAAAAPVIAVVGSKQAGKSTFARLLVNSLLNTSPTVAYLDTDCGQSEFTAPGLVSLTLVHQILTGPPHLHQQQPARAHFVGDTSPQTDPMLYIRSVASLLDWFRAHASQQHSSGVWQTVPPLVINTHGWIKGAGLVMLAEVLASAQISHLVQLQSLQPKRNLPDDVSWFADATMQRIESWLLPAADALAADWLRCSQQYAGQPANGDQFTFHRCNTPSVMHILLAGGQLAKTLSPVDTRALSWLAFARGCLDAQRLADSAPEAYDSAGFAATAWSLACQPPYATAWLELSIQVLHCAVPASELPAAINGAVVGLAVASEVQLQTYRHTMNSTADAAPLPCLGLGVVRSLNVEAGLLFLLTPLGQADLQHVNILQVGRLQLPPGLLQAPGLQSPYLTSFSLTSDASASRSMKSRGNLLRVAQQ